VILPLALGNGGVFPSGCARVGGASTGGGCTTCGPRAVPGTLT